MPAQHRHVQRRVQPLIGRIDRRTRVQQGAHDGGASGLRRPVQRGAVAPAHGARFGPRLEQQRDQLRVAPARGPVQRGDHVAIDRVDVRALADEKHRELAVSVFLRPMQQGGAVGMLSGRRSAAGEERTDRIGVAALGGLEESGAQTRAEGTDYRDATIQLVEYFGERIPQARVHVRSAEELIEQMHRQMRLYTLSIPSFNYQMTPKISLNTRCSISISENLSINGQTRSSDQLGIWSYNINP